MKPTADSSDSLACCPGLQSGAGTRRLGLPESLRRRSGGSGCRPGIARALSLVALLVLGACQQGGVWANVPRDDSPDGQACRREAEQDPEVRRIARTATSGNLAQDERVREELLAALPRAWRACMTRRGALPPGGVEQLRRTTF